MSLAPILATSAIVQLHLLAALVSLILAAIQISGVKRGLRHRWVGWGFVLAMTVTAVSSFWIAGIRHGQFSPIHLLSILTLMSLPIAVIARRQGNIRRHRQAMIGLVSGLVVAGLFTLLPGRVLHSAIFGL